ncbi:hypothetical protein AMATHDRAFT_8572 [Amanita thiersii Skay4041]|uniref:Galectin n=1 Tax=Amanita thiersii Skay4041 TaxID=703135 RepID=A0A2A9NDK0_9AGAR|nr:hypothetical protein AMATHDRAFT_8572 [Amanita thiersii Skay4041]
MFSIVPLGSQVDLHHPLKAEGIVVLQSTKNNISTTTETIRMLLLSSQDDQILHVSVRPSQNVIVFNSRTHNGNFGPEERVTIDHKIKSNSPTFTFYDHGDRFQVMIDYKTVIYYKKREGLTGPVTKIGYNADGTSFLSDALGVTQYESFASVYPRNI